MSEPVADIVDLPKIIKTDKRAGKPNFQTPKMRSPLDNPAVRAIIDARQEYCREWVTKHTSHPKMKAIIEVIGEHDPEGDPHWEYLADLILFEFICHLRKVENNSASELLKAEGAEWQRFLEDCRKAGVGLE